jgi:hypothetical protein
MPWMIRVVLSLNSACGKPVFQRLQPLVLPHNLLPKLSKPSADRAGKVMK